MDEQKIRAWWSHRQGLDGTLNGASAAAVLEKAGWARSVGGSGPYLGLFARAGLGREAVDAAVAKIEIHELPSARNCTYVLPAGDFALGLKVGQAFADNDMKVGRKLGVTDREVDKLGDVVIQALKNGPLDPDELKEAVGGAVRNLGEEGKKKGVTTTLPLALGRLQAMGEIRRIPVNGRLDQQRYRYTVWSPNPLAKFKLSDKEAYTELARRYFTWIGPATLAEFQWFSGLGVKASKEAVEPLKLEPIEDGDDHLMLHGEREKLKAFQVPKQPQYVLTSGIDGMLLLRRDVKGLVAAEDSKKSVRTEKGNVAPGTLVDLPNHAILDRGRLVGLWEYDPATESIAWMAFVAKDAGLKKAVARMEEYVRTDLGDARSFSLDTPKSRVPRIAALRAAGGA
jgi:winged helix DNA-binding protein